MKEIKKNNLSAKVGSVLFVLAPIIISVVALVVSWLSYQATSSYYNLASRPYIMIDSVFKDKVTSFISIKISCLQSPVKVSRVSMKWIDLNNSREYLPLKNDFIMFPGQSNYISSVFSYPRNGDIGKFIVKIEYESFSKKGSYSYYVEHNYVSNDSNGRWLIEVVSAN